MVFQCNSKTSVKHFMALQGSLHHNHNTTVELAIITTAVDKNYIELTKAVYKS